MDMLSFEIPSIVLGCYCIGIILRTLVPGKEVNRFIPLIVGISGVLLSVWGNMKFTPDTVVCGLVSGLASTGVHQSFKNILNGVGSDEKDSDETIE